VGCGYDGGSAPRAPHQARAPPVKEAWLVRLVGPGCIRYRECTQVHNIYRIAFYTLLLPPRLPRPTSPPTQPNHPCPLGPANRTIPLPPIPPEPNWFLPRFPHQIPFLAPEPCDDSRGWRRLRWRATAARVSGGDRGAVGECSQAVRRAPTGSYPRAPRSVRR
jgi:hypothetical protein